MEIKTKYNVGDTIYYISGDDVVETIIKCIEIGSCGLSYTMAMCYIAKGEDELYSTREEAERALETTYNNLLNGYVRNLNKTNFDNPDTDIARFRSLEECCKKLNKKFRIEIVG